MKAKWQTWGMGLVVLMVPAITYAGDGDVHARETRATHMYTGADQLARSDGYYAQARDAFSTGDRSIVALTVAGDKDAQEWMDGWFKLFALADLTEDVSFDEFQLRLTESMQSQASALEGLRARASAIDDATAEARRLLDNGPVPDVPELVDFKEVIDGLRTREAELRDAIADVGKSATSRVQALDDISGKSRMIILARVKAALLAHARYPLDRALAAVQSYLAAEAIVAPIVARVGAAENRMDTLIVNLAIFQADDALTASRALCTEARTQLEGVTGEGAYVRVSKQRVSDLCDAIEDHYTTLASGGVSRSEIVFQYLDSAKGQLHELCSIASPPVSCEKLAVLAALERADLEAMDDAHLRFVEVGWAKELEIAKRKGRAT
jgi:hypothetical protein